MVAGEKNVELGGKNEKGERKKRLAPPAANLFVGNYIKNVEKALKTHL